MRLQFADLVEVPEGVARDQLQPLLTVQFAEGGMWHHVLTQVSGGVPRPGEQIGASFAEPLKTSSGVRELSGGVQARRRG